GGTVRRGWRAMPRVAPPLAALVVASLVTIATLVCIGLWLGFRVVWDLIGQGKAPAAWELGLLGISQPAGGQALRAAIAAAVAPRLVILARSEEHTSELQSLTNLVCRLLLEKKKTAPHSPIH